jgi:hypothetical protein
MNFRCFHRPLCVSPRYYRFTVSKPLSITTKMNTVADAIILRNTIVNESGFPFFFEKISFVAQAPYTCTDLNMMQVPEPRPVTSRRCAVSRCGRATDAAATFGIANAGSSCSNVDALVLPAPFAESDATSYMRHQDSRCFMSVASHVAA